MAKRTLLARWLKKHRRSHSDFARSVGADRSQIYRCAKGERAPGRTLALAIDRETGGEVPAEYWDRRSARRREPRAASLHDGHSTTAARDAPGSCAVKPALNVGDL